MIDGFLRDEINEAFRLDDIERAKWQAPEPSPPQRHEMIHKTFTPPQEQAATMDAATEARWNEWFEASFKNAAERWLLPAVGEALGDVAGELRKELRKEFDAELGKLRAEVNLLTGIARGQIADRKRERNVA